MSARAVVLGLASLLSQPAWAAADVVASVALPTSTFVYDTGRVNVTVSNRGNKTANAVEVVIALPETHTSPQVHVLGDLGARDGRCTQVGTTLECTLGALRKGASTTVWFDIALPYSAEPIVFDADATTTSPENSTSNNGDTETAAPLYDAVPIAVGDGAFIAHCTGTNLISFFECELYPSSISTHEHVFGASGTLSIPVAPDFTGTWSQASPDRLTFSYFDETGALAATFVGRGVSPDCFEGLTTFPDSDYVSPYSVCLQ